MNDHNIADYGDRIADVYDLLEAPSQDTDGAVMALLELAGSGPVLELGVGTGRLALPLQEEGLEVHGIEASPAMVARLRAKRGGKTITVVAGDFAEVAAPTNYPLVFAAFNTFCALLTQDEQLRCLANVARALRPGGLLAVETTVPDCERLAHRGGVWPRFVDRQMAVLHTATVDQVSQRVRGQYLLISDGSIRTFPVDLRYVWPSELDLMARAAGLSLRDRWGGWRRQPFVDTSEVQVSIYEKGGE